MVPLRGLQAYDEGHCRFYTLKVFACNLFRCVMAGQRCFIL